MKPLCACTFQVLQHSISSLIFDRLRPCLRIPRQLYLPQPSPNNLCLPIIERRRPLIMHHRLRPAPSKLRVQNIIPLHRRRDQRLRHLPHPELRLHDPLPSLPFPLDLNLDFPDLPPQRHGRQCGRDIGHAIGLLIAQPPAPLYPRERPVGFRIERERLGPPGLVQLPVFAQFLERLQAVPLGWCGGCRVCGRLCCGEVYAG